MPSTHRPHAPARPANAPPAPDPPPPADTAPPNQQTKAAQPQGQSPPQPPPPQQQQRGLNITDLKDMSIQKLTQIAKDLNVGGATGMRKQELIFQILKAQTEQSGFI